jgi:hypothetical protein
MVGILVVEANFEDALDCPDLVVFDAKFEDAFDCPDLVGMKAVLLGVKQ